MSKVPATDAELEKPDEYDFSQGVRGKYAACSAAGSNLKEATPMSRIEEAEKLLSGMTRGEKAQVLQWVARDLGDAFPGIDSSPEVCGGEPRIVRTRIPVWILVQARHLGTSEAELLRSYPTLRAEDLANAWSYYRTHRDEIEQQIRDNEGA